MSTGRLELMTPEGKEKEGAPSHTDGAPSSHLVVADYLA